MTNFARLDSKGEAIETWSFGSMTPAEMFEPALAATFVECPDNVTSGWIYVPKSKTWKAPAVSAPTVNPLVSYPVLSVTDFQLCFTIQERVQIRASTDPVVKEFVRLIDDPRTTTVPLGLQSIQDMITYLSQTNIMPAQDPVTTYIGPERVAQVIAGQLQ